MKRRKGRIILGTTAVAVALTFGGCTGGNNPSAEAGSSAAVTVQESTQEQPEPEEAEKAGDSENAGQEQAGASENADQDQTGTSENADQDQADSVSQTSEASQSEEDEEETDKDFEVFDPLDNYNVVVYGPPKED